MSIDQHAVIVVLPQPWLDLRFEVPEQRADVTVSIDYEVALYAVTMTMQIAALVVQGFVAMSGVELVLLLNDHELPSSHRLPPAVSVEPKWREITGPVRMGR